MEEYVLNRNLIILALLTLVFLASSFVGGETRPSSVEKDLSAISINGKNLDVYFFYGLGCPHCAKVAPFLTSMARKYPIRLHSLDVYNNRSCLSLFDDLSRRYNLPLDHRGVPTVFVSDAYFVGDQPIVDGFEEVVRKALNGNTILATQAPKVEDSGSSCQELAPTNNLSLVVLTTSALVDALSPCSITILVFLIGARILIDRRKRALRVGLGFSLSVFISYFLFGLGLLTIVQLSSLSQIFSSVAGLIALAVGIVYLKDALWHDWGGAIIEVPDSVKPLLLKMLKGVTSPVGAFMMGFVVTLFELPCTGGPYLIVLGQLADSVTRLQAIPMLLYYNLIFVSPLIVISLLLYSGVFSIDRARELGNKNKGLFRLAGGILMVPLGLLLMPFSFVFQLALSLLNFFRVTGLLLLIVLILHLFGARDLRGRFARCFGLIILLLFSSLTVQLPVVTYRSVSPSAKVNTTSCGSTITANTVLNEDLLNCPGRGLEIRASGITLDCNGHTISGIEGSATTGIYINYVDQVTVKNCRIENFRDGIYLYFASYNNIIYNNISNCHAWGSYPADGWGIFLWSTTGVPELRTAYNTISFNRIDGNNNDRAAGIWLRTSQSYSNVITRNKIYSTGYFGIRVDSNGNDISDNEIADNEWNGLGFFGSANTVDRNIVCYNSPYDIQFGGGSGDNNMCDNPSGWNDDGTIGCTYTCPPRIRALAVPLNWQSDQTAFDQEVDTQLNFFINDVPLKDCQYKVDVQKLDVTSQNFDDFTCSQSNCGVWSVKPFVESLGINPRNYDWIIGYAETSPCSPIAGCSNGVDTAWVTPGDDSVTAHEIGHLYDLEDEYCSNPAGSTDSKCNDGDMGGFGDSGNDGALTGDKNWLDADLECDPNLDTCCFTSCAPAYPYVCCLGNKNSKGGRATMSYKGASGPRGFDDHSKAYLNSIEQLRCPIIPSAQMLGIQSQIPGKVLDVSLWVYRNDSVDEKFVILMDGMPTSYHQDGNYSLRVFDDGGTLIWDESLDINFGYNGPVVLGEDYSGISNEKFPLSYKIPYDSSMHELKLYHNGSEIHSRILDFCDLDLVCDDTETYLSCPEDCPLNENDGICIPQGDGTCDPDCARSVDSDCADDVALLALTPSKTIIGQGLITKVNVTTQNQGNYEETFNITLYANATVVGQNLITIPSNNIATITFVWDTSSYPYGNYSMRAVADTVPGETDIIDNTLTDSWVIVTIIGDIDGDGIVSVTDLASLVEAYGSDPSMLDWDPYCDFNSDNLVDAEDAYLLGRNYGKTT